MITTHHFSDDSPVWIYQSDRLLTNAESAEIQQDLHSFIAQWTSHGNQLKAEALILHNIFVVIIVESTVELPSGCSIDASVHLIKDLEVKYQVNFFDRLKICYRKEDQFVISSQSSLRQSAKNGEIHADTLIFDNSARTYADWLNSWERPISETWLKKIF